MIDETLIGIVSAYVGAMAAFVMVVLSGRTRYFVAFGVCAGGFLFFLPGTASAASLLPAAGAPAWLLPTASGGLICFVSILCAVHRAFLGVVAYLIGVLIILATLA